MSYADRVAEDARLIILRELAVQVDGRLNEVALQRVLEAFAITRSRDYVRTQLTRLEEVGGVQVSQAGTVMIASLTREGRDHVERRSILSGVSRPSDDR